MAALFGQSISTLLFVAGVALCILEAFAPGAHFIVVGVALLVAGLVGLLVPPLATPLVLSLLVLASGVGAFYFYRRLNLYGGTDRGVTRSSADLAGEQGFVIDRVTPRTGRVKLHAGGFDPTYAARSVEGEIPEGTAVIVVDPGGGNVLTVEPLSPMDEIDRELARGRQNARASETATNRESDRESTEETAE